MITKEEMIYLLVDACPSFRQTFEGLNEFHGELLPDILIDDFADHILGLQYNKETSEFDKVSKVIEKLKNEGNDEVKELLMNGFFGVIDEHFKKLRNVNN